MGSMSQPMKGSPGQYVRPTLSGYPITEYAPVMGKGRMEGRVVNYRQMPATRSTPSPGLLPYMQESYADAMARNRARIAGNPYPDISRSRGLMDQPADFDAIQARVDARVNAVKQMTQAAVNDALAEATSSPASSPAPTAPRGGAPRRTMFENVVSPLLQGQGVPSYPYPAPMVPSMMGAIQQANDMNSQAMQLGDPTAALAIRGAQIRHSQGVSTVGDLLDVGEAVAEMTKKQRLGMHMEWLKRDARRHAMSQSGTQLI